MHTLCLRNSTWLLLVGSATLSMETSPFAQIKYSPPKITTNKTTFKKHGNQANHIFIFLGVGGGWPSFPWWLKDSLSFRKPWLPFFRSLALKCSYGALDTQNAPFQRPGWRHEEKRPPPTRFGDVWGKYDPVILGVSEKQGETPKMDGL